MGYGNYVNRSDLSIDIGERGVLLDEPTSRLNIVTHEDGEDAVGLDNVLDVNLSESTRRGVHGRLEQLLSVHLAETFVALDGDRALSTLVIADESLALLIVPAILGILALLAEIEWRSGDVDVSALDKLSLIHISEPTRPY